MVSEDFAKEIRAALDAGRPVRVTATLTVRPKEGKMTQDVFHCYLKKSNAHGKPCHVREDLIISNVDCRVLHGFTALIRVERGALATLLGDSEGPAHTEWQGSSRNFKDKYVLGGVVIKFVANFANELTARVYGASRQLDRELLRDMFQEVKPVDNKDGTKPRAGRTQKLEGDPGRPIPEPKRPSYRVGELSNGFVVASANQVDLTGQSLRVMAAYDSAKGNPFKTYSSADFKLSKRPIVIACEGCSYKTNTDNELVFEVHAPVFSVEELGFDVNRDLIVNAAVLRTETQHLSEVEDGLEGQAE
jgi:hypothetical protein